jgi:putative ABC transport system substrate-binding protein
MMRRREFITLMGGAAAWPLAARAQQPPIPVVGFLFDGSPEAGGANVAAAFRKGLGETGYVEGRNVTIEYRWSEGQNDRLPALAADLVRRRVAIIATPNDIETTLAAKAATTTIPIVFSAAVDPVQAGLVASLNRPGGNLTGFTSMNVELGAKRLGLLHELVPGAARFALIVNPNFPAIESVVADLRAAAATIGRPIEVLYAGTDRDVETAFASLGQKRVDALLFGNRLPPGNKQLGMLAASHAVPAIHSAREFVEAGGLMSYGTDLLDQARQVGLYTGAPKVFERVSGGWGRLGTTVIRLEVADGATVQDALATAWCNVADVASVLDADIAEAVGAVGVASVNDVASVLDLTKSAEAADVVDAASVVDAVDVTETAEAADFVDAARVVNVEPYDHLKSVIERLQVCW